MPHIDRLQFIPRVSAGSAERPRHIGNRSAVVPMIPSLRDGMN